MIFLADFRSSGQNLAKYTASVYIAPDVLANSSINLWYNEHEFAKQSDVDNLSRIYNDDRKAIGHFTQVVNERTSHLGCAISYYYLDGKQSYFVCNYSSANMLASPIYKSGKTASGCTYKNNPLYPGLCRTNEKL